MTEKDQLHFFEGAEKLLEIWFTGYEEGSDGDLRKIPRYVLRKCFKNVLSFSDSLIFLFDDFNRQKLESLLKLVHCEVISFTSNEFIDAYVLRYA